MDNIFAAVAALNKKGMVFGTEVTRSVLDKLGSPDDKLKIIHIAGTNGKGSTAEYITQILTAAGKRTGTFMSPMAESYFEQFRICGEPILKDKLAVYLKKAYDAAAGEATAFEVETAAALSAFCGEGCEYAVLECGLGGRYDATNAVNKKELAIITSIGLEHTAALGNTLNSICSHKAGIIKDCPAVVCALQEEEVKKYFKALGAIFADKGFMLLDVFFGGTRFLYEGREYFTPAYGPEQAYDAAAAIEAAYLLHIDLDAINAGVARFDIPGRLQIIEKSGNTYIVDGGHNPAAVKPLAGLLERFDPKNVTLVYGSLSDKDICGNLALLCGRAEKIVAVKPNSPRAMDMEDILSACRRYFKNVSSAASVSGALESCGGTVVVCGSFTLVKEALSWINKR